MAKLALMGGSRILESRSDYLFHWPVVNDAMVAAQTKVLLDGNMSGTNISRQFETEFAAWQGRKYALTHNNGTSALTAAMYGVGLGRGDEIICPDITYWASCTGALTLGATVVFCDIDPETLQIDPASLESRITPRTKAVMVVHYMSHPAPMDEIMAIARRHGIRVIEDVSHAQGGHYRGRMLGTFGDVAAMSLMSGKSFCIGEGGILVTDDFEIYRRAIRLGHYDRIGDVYSDEEIAETKNLPFGGLKNRMHQVSAAIGLEQLKKYESEIAEIDRAMKYFWSGVSDVPGIRKIYPKDAGSDKAGWYASRFHYAPAAFKGVSNVTFCKALNAEVGGAFSYGCNMPLHKSSLFFDVDVYGDGRPTASAFLPEGVDPRALSGDLPVAEGINSALLSEPWFKHDDHALIDPYIEAIHKVAANCEELLPANDTAPILGGAALSARKK